jgi:hypothetical protein
MYGRNVYDFTVTLLYFAVRQNLGPVFTFSARVVKQTVTPAAVILPGERQPL